MAFTTVAFLSDEGDRLPITHQDDVGALAHAQPPGGTNSRRMRCLNTMQDGIPTGTPASDVPVNDVCWEAYGTVIGSSDVAIRFLEHADNPG